MSENEERQHQQSSDFPTSGYEAAEEERHSLKGEEEEERNTSVAGQNEEEQSPQESATQRKRSGRGEGGGKRHSDTTIATAASAWQITLIDLDKQLNRQSRLMERMSDDVRQLKKQFNQVQRDLAKFEKRMEKMKTTTRSSSSAKRGKRRG
jgi:hypothetical protein